MAATDIKILEARLLTRDSAITGSTVTKCATRLQQLFAAVRDDNKTPENNATDVAQEAFSRDLLMYRAEMGKFDQSFNMLDQEAVEYKNLESDIEAKIEQTSQSIVALTQELVQQKKLKQHREECEALSRIVNLVPSTRKIMASSDVVRDEISRLEEQLSSTEDIESMRHRQVNLLLQSIADLSKSLEEEDELQRQLQALQQSVDNQTQDDDEAAEDNDEEGDGDDESRDKRSERSKTKRKKSSDGDGEGDELEVDTAVEEQKAGIEEGEEHEDSEGGAKKKQKVAGSDEASGDRALELSTSTSGSVASSSDSTDGKMNSPVAMSVKEKLQQQQAKRAQKKLEKELLEKEQQAKAQGTTVTEEGEEEEGAMDTSA